MDFKITVSGRRLTPPPAAAWKKSSPCRAAPRHDPQMGSLYANAGLMCDHVLNDPAMAQKLYAAALQVHPGNKTAQEQARLIRHKLNGRNPGVGASQASP